VPARQSLVAVLALCGAAAAYAGAPSSAEPSTGPSTETSTETSTIYVARRGWHIDIGMAAADLAPPLSQAAAALPCARYVFFGFADKHYLLAKNHHAPVLVAALFPGAGIVLTTGLTNSPAQAFGATHVIALTVPEDAMRTLQSFIWRSLRTQDGLLTVFRDGPYEDSVYFLATQKYSAFHTCNTWGAEALRAAGFHVHTAGVIFAGQLWIQARRLKRDQSGALGASLLFGTSDERIFSLNASIAGRLAAVLADHGGG
jgi:Protein of unknown function (DUF2459)